MTKSELLFLNNPYLHRFCINAGILEQFEKLINLDTAESRTEAANLISKFKFNDNLAYEIYSGVRRTVIIGNGDVHNREEGIAREKESGVDGIMIGRGIFRNPWAFLPIEVSSKLNTKENRLEMLLEHLIKWNEAWSDQKHFPAMKKFVKMYINDYPNAKDFRMELMDMNSPDEMIERVSIELGRDKL